MARQLRFNGTVGSGVWSPSVHRDRIINLDEFEGLFRTFGHSAWRLETRRRYASNEATDTYRQFVQTGRVE